MGGDVSKNFKIIENADLEVVKADLGKDKTLSWSLLRAIPVSLSGDEKEIEFSVFDYGENCLQYNNAYEILRSIRHPNIVSIKKDPCLKSNRCRFVTDPLLPLLEVLSSLDFQEIMGGLHDLYRALNFLHYSAGICHKSVGLGSLFVSLDGTWKLGCFESAERILGGNFYQDQKDLLILIEELKKKLGDLKDGDLRSLAILHKEIEDLITSSKQDKFQLSSQIFEQCKFIQIRTFLIEMLMKSSKEKVEFFQSLISELNELPEELVARRLSTLLLQRFVLLDKTARDLFLPSFLTPKDGNTKPSPCITPVIKGTNFVKYVCPVLLKVFTVHDTSIRTTLLENFTRYFKFFTRQQLKDTILNQLLLSARDQNDKLVEMSLRALADLVPVLGGDLIIRSQRTQYFYDGQMKELTTVQSSNLENAMPPTENSLDTLDGILQNENSSEQNIKDSKQKDLKKLVSTVDLSNAKLNLGRKISNEIRLEQLEDHPLPLRTWKDDDLTTTGNVHLEEDLVRSKSLESLTKNHLCSKMAKPIAVIEPKTTYQLGESSIIEVKDIDSGSKEEFLKKTLESVMKLDIKLKNLRQANISFDKSTANHHSKAVSPSVTLLDISKGNSTNHTKSPTPNKLPTECNSDITKLPSETRLNDDWDEKWEDLEIPSTNKSLPFYASNRDANMLSQLQNNKSVFDDPKIKVHSTQKHHIKTSDVPLGFGYDVKQIQVKVKPKESSEDDFEQKLFEELMTCTEPTNKNHMHHTPALDADETGTSGWETEELDLDLE